jgi:hypothetical protein
MPDGRLRRAKAYTRSQITRGNALMARAGTLFCQTEMKAETLGEKEKKSDELNQYIITYPPFFNFV